MFVDKSTQIWVHNFCRELWGLSQFVVWRDLQTLRSWDHKSVVDLGVFRTLLSCEHGQRTNKNYNQMTEHRQHTLHVQMDQTCPRSNSHRNLRPIQSDRCTVFPIAHHCTTSINTINVCSATHTQSDFLSTPMIRAVLLISTVQQNLSISLCVTTCPFCL